MMKTMQAFAMGYANRGREMMVFDWSKAAQIIKESGAQNAAAGLSGDWGYTGGEILSDGKPVPQDETYTYLASTWATPELEVDGARMDCFIMEGQTEWHSGTYWPKEALEILEQ